jgi:hypothetical protein
MSSSTPDKSEEGTLSHATSTVSSLAKESKFAASQEISPPPTRKESVFESPAPSENKDSKTTAVPTVKPQVTEKYADENEKRLAEFVLAKEKKQATTNGTAAREVRDEQINGLVKESDKVNKATL